MLFAPKPAAIIVCNGKQYTVGRVKRKFWSQLRRDDYIFIVSTPEGLQEKDFAMWPGRIVENALIHKKTLRFRPEPAYPNDDEFFDFSLDCIQHIYYPLAFVGEGAVVAPPPRKRCFNKTAANV